MEKYEKKKGSEVKQYHGKDSEDNFKESRKHIKSFKIFQEKNSVRIYIICPDKPSYFGLDRSQDRGAPVLKRNTWP